MRSIRNITRGVISRKIVTDVIDPNTFKLDFETAIGLDSKGRTWATNGSIARSNTVSQQGAFSLYSTNAGSGMISLADDSLLSNLGDFTYDWWAYPTTLTQAETEFMDYRKNASDAGGVAFIAVNSAFRVWNFTDKYILNIDNFFTLNTWVRITVTRKDGTIYVYRNGTLVGQVLYTRNLTSNFRSLGGRYVQLTGSWYSFIGYTDNYVINPNKALTTTNFNPNAILK